MHLSYDETATETLYSAPIIFDRNAHNVPAIVRVADILWCAAGLSGLYQGSTIAPPTSVYSLPLVLVDRVGGWDCDSEAIGEDLHMYLKCFFALNGNLTTRTILSPVSQSNVIAEGKGSGIRGIARDMRARYRQALRHMWGALDTGFALRQAFKLWQERKHTLRAFRPLHSSPCVQMSTQSFILFTMANVLSETPAAFTYLRTKLTGCTRNRLQKAVYSPTLRKIFSKNPTTSEFSTSSTASSKPTSCRCT